MVAYRFGRDVVVGFVYLSSLCSSFWYENYFICILDQSAQSVLNDEMTHYP